MPRPENAELKNEILAQARELFREKGYRATSYAEIAAAAGTTKGLLQYYYPKKDQLAYALMTQVLERARAVLGYDDQPASLAAADTEVYQQLYRIGQLFFDYLLGKGGYTKFLQDVTSDFDLVGSVLAFDLNWALEYAQLGDRANDREIVESVVMTMGGFYALLHYDLGHDLQMDVQRRLRVVMREFMVATGVSDRVASEALDAAEFTPGELENALKRM